MPWYIPLLSAIVGGAIGFFSAYKVSQVNFDRQNAADARSLLVVFAGEIDIITVVLRRYLDASAGNVYAVLPEKFDIAGLAQVYKSNCGKLGMLDAGLLDSIMKFYSRLLTVNPVSSGVPAGATYIDKSLLLGCIDLGKAAQGAIISALGEDR